VIYDNSLIQKVYDRSPVAVQHLWVSLYGTIRQSQRRSPAFRRYQRELERSQWLSPAELQALQTKRLRALMVHAYDHVPYYRRLFDERKLKPADIQSADDLYKLPILTRQDVRRHAAHLRARNIPARRVTQNRTGGTTGVALSFTLDHDRVLFDRAITERHWGWAGYRPGDRLAIMRFWIQLFAQTPPGAYWRHDWASNYLYVAGSWFTRQHAPRMVEKLAAWRPAYLAGFASNIHVLAQYMARQGIQIPLRACFPSSEMLDREARQVIERSFACRVWERYGMGERLVVGSQCEHGSLHQNVEFGLLQVDSPLGTPAAPGAPGELVQTGLTNFSMPLIRYASGDLGSVPEGVCPCGRGLPLMGPVEGRTSDLLVTPEGRLISPASMAGFAAGVYNAERCQVVQKRVGEAIIRVQPGPDFSEADAAELIRQMHLRVGTSTTCRVELTDELQSPQTSKFRYIVSEVDPAEVAGLTLESPRPDPPSSHAKQSGTSQPGQP
jgi:phenylacetate-coenzyme A ligase PaaK-like adenylate-forming protein